MHTPLVSELSAPYKEFRYLAASQLCASAAALRLGPSCPDPLNQFVSFLIALFPLSFVDLSKDFQSIHNSELHDNDFYYDGCKKKHKSDSVNCQIWLVKYKVSSSD